MAAISHVFMTPVQWLAEVSTELCGGQPLETVVVGGDYLTRPALEDAVALHPTELRRWGPPGDDPYRIVVPPRPHQAVWAKRCVVQMQLEGPGTELVWYLVVPRDQCGAGTTMDALWRMVPQASALLEAKDLAVQVKVIGERAPLLRVPATVDEKVLPPQTWERAWLPMDRVLVALVVRRAAGRPSAPSLAAVRGKLPQPKSDGLELLRLEYVLPPATRQSGAEKALHTALRKLAQEMQLPVVPGPQMLRQVVVQHGSVLAVLAVPVAHAVEWLRGSGCGGLYLRPFWTATTSPSLAREKFSLLWLKGKAERGPELWKVFRHKEGVVGLLLAGKDVALRVDQKAKVAELQAQLGLSLGNPEERFRQAVKGQRWWRLGPLTEAESWQAMEMVRATGLEPLRGELRRARMGKWRHAVYFAAVGSPSRTSFDDGSRTSSEAFLVEAAAPPQVVAKAAVAGSRTGNGAALSQLSTWAGPRRQPAPAEAALKHQQELPPQQPWQSQQRPQEPKQGPQKKQRQRQHEQQRPPLGQESLARSSPVLRDGLGGGLEELKAIIEDLRLELRALRRENELLRRAQVVDPWRWHGPVSSTSLLPPLMPVTLQPPAPESPVRPVAMEQDKDTLGTRSREHGETPEAKRNPSVARTLVVDPPHDV